MEYSTYRVLNTSTNLITEASMDYWSAIELAESMSRDSKRVGRNPQYEVLKSVCYVQREPIVIEDEPRVTYLKEA
jgi:hypothetical protein